MKRIELKSIKIVVKGQDDKDIENNFDYKENLVNALNQRPIEERTGQPRGFGPVEMRRRIKLIKMVEECKDNKLLLETSEYNELKKCVNSQKWQIVHPVIIQYIDDVDNAEDVKVEEKR